jgi:hypothetical protein
MQFRRKCLIILLFTGMDGSIRFLVRLLGGASWRALRLCREADVPSSPIRVTIADAKS